MDEYLQHYPGRQFDLKGNVMKMQFDLSTVRVLIFGAFMAGFSSLLLIMMWGHHIKVDGQPKPFDYSRCAYIVPTLAEGPDMFTSPYKNAGRTPEGRWCISID